MRVRNYTVPHKRAWGHGPDLELRFLYVLVLYRIPSLQLYLFLQSYQIANLGLRKTADKSSRVKANDDLAPEQIRKVKRSSLLLSSLHHTEPTFPMLNSVEKLQLVKG